MSAAPLNPTSLFFARETLHRPLLSLIPPPPRAPPPPSLHLPHPCIPNGSAVTSSAALEAMEGRFQGPSVSEILNISRNPKCQFLVQFDQMLCLLFLFFFVNCPCCQISRKTCRCISFVCFIHEHTFKFPQKFKQTKIIPILGQKLWTFVSILLHNFFP